MVECKGLIFRRLTTCFSYFARTNYYNGGKGRVGHILYILTLLKLEFGNSVKCSVTSCFQIHRFVWVRDKRFLEIGNQKGFSLKSNVMLFAFFLFYTAVSNVSRYLRINKNVRIGAQIDCVNCCCLVEAYLGHAPPPKPRPGSPAPEGHANQI